MRKTSQGVRDLNHNFGPAPKRSEYPDNCTLGLHPWAEWEIIGAGFAIRECTECEEKEYSNRSKEMKNQPFERLSKAA